MLPQTGKGHRRRRVPCASAKMWCGTRDKCQSGLGSVPQKVERDEGLTKESVKEVQQQQSVSASRRCGNAKWRCGPTARGATYMSQDVVCCMCTSGKSRRFSILIPV